MRKYVLIVVLLISMSCVLNQRTASIKGVVRDSVSKELLPGALVSIMGTKWRTIADSNGAFIIRKVAFRKYVIAASYTTSDVKIKYRTHYDTIDVIQNIEDVDLIVVKDTTKWFPCPPDGKTTIMSSWEFSGNIQGEITDGKTGVPIKNAKVTIGKKKIHHISDSLGKFTFNRLITGHYPLSISKEGYRPSETIRIEVFPDSTIEVRSTLTPLPDSAKP